MNLKREMISSKDLAQEVSSQLGTDVSEFLVSKIIELYIQEKQFALEAGKAVVENKMATRYQVRYYNTNEGGERFYTVKVQNVLARDYKQTLIKAVESDKALLEAYSSRNLDNFNDQLRLYLDEVNQSTSKVGEQENAESESIKLK